MLQPRCSAIAVLVAGRVGAGVGARVPPTMVIER
jgi:hypothetical protein